MSTTPSIQQAFCPPLWIQQTGVAFFCVFFSLSLFFLVGEKERLPLQHHSSFLPPLQHPPFPPSLLIFMDLSANGLVILLRSESTVSRLPFLPLSGLSGQSEPSAECRGRGQLAPTKLLFFLPCYLLPPYPLPPSPAPPPRQSV